MVTSKGPWKVPVAVHDIPETGRRFDLVADEATRDAVAAVSPDHQAAALLCMSDVFAYITTSAEVRALWV